MLQSFIGDRRAVIAITFALALLPLLGLSALAFDLTRIYVAQTRMQNALDSASLAAASAYGRDESDIRRIAQIYFDRNYASTGWLPEATLNVALNDSTYTLDASAEFETTFMWTGGVDRLDIAASSEAIAEPSGLEVALVLDVTKSMLEITGGTTRLEALKTSAIRLVDILTASARNPDLVRFSIIPYSATVNIGVGNAAFVDGAEPGNFPGTEWAGCVMARPGIGDVRDSYNGGSGGSAGKWTAYRWPMEPNQLTVGGSSAAYCDNPARTGSTTEYASVIDIFNPAGGYPSVSSGPNRSCPQAVEPLTSDHARIRDRINALSAFEGGGTMTALGTAWGLRTLSPAQPFSEGEPYEDDRWRKIMIIMTDGEQNLSQNADAAGNSCTAVSALSGSAWRHQPQDFGATGSQFDGGAIEHWTAYGYPMSAARFGSNDYDRVINSLENRLRTACNEIKNVVVDDRSKITIYSLTFGDSVDWDTRNLVQSCASNADNYFHAPSGSALEDAFSEIAYEILSARISR